MLSTNLSKINRHWLSDLICLAILFSTFYAIWIGSYALFTPDEGRYSEVAREMVVTGDYITPRLNGVAFLDKPILYYWLQAFAIKIFGLKEWALRFWPAFMGVFGCLMVYLAGSVLYNRRTGLVSATILATAPLYYGAAHYANLDLEVASLIGSSLLFFIMAAHLPQSKLRKTFMVSAYFFAALAFLTKGLIGLAFPIMIIGSWVLILNRWTILKKMHLVTGLILFLAIVIPWYVMAQRANPEFLHFFFVTQQVTRFLTQAEFNNKTSFWFYIPIVLAGIFPWSIFMIQSLAYHMRHLWKNKKEHASSLFLLLWLSIVFVFFSIPKSKTVGYILPVLAPLALLIGNYIDYKWNKVKSTGVKASLISFIIICSLTAAGFAYAPKINELEIPTTLLPYLQASALLFFTAAVTSLFLIGTKKIYKFFIILLCTAVSFLLIMSASSSALNKRSIKPLTTELNSLIKPEDEIVTYYKFYYDLPIYTGKRVTIVADWNAPDIASNDNWVRELWYGMPFQDTHEWLIDEDTLWKRWGENRRLFIITDVNYLEQLKSSAKGNVYMIAKYKNTCLLSNQKTIIE